jgi:hypothetical protein
MFTKFHVGAVSVILEDDGLYLGKIVLLCRLHWAAHAFDGQTACVSRISRDDHCERVLTVRMWKWLRPTFLVVIVQGKSPLYTVMRVGTILSMGLYYDIAWGDAGIPVL